MITGYDYFLSGDNAKAACQALHRSEQHDAGAIVVFKNKRLFNSARGNDDFFCSDPKQFLTCVGRSIRQQQRVIVIVKPDGGCSSSKIDAAIAVGCIIKGKTPHFDYIARASIDGIMRVSLDNKKPIGNCILTCLTKKQALERINKGSEAAKAVTSILSK